MPSPPFYEREHIAVKKPELPPKVRSLEEYDGPRCFAIPGNHDWFDGLDIFMKYICHKSWLGGWMLPQEQSYFALKLPQGWWIFGLDQSLLMDIDIFQFKYFSNIADNEVEDDGVVILVTHEPNWLLDWYWDRSTGKNVTYLIQQHLRGRCKVRFAGDLHFYYRHSARNPSTTQDLSRSQPSSPSKLSPSVSAWPSFTRWPPSSSTGVSPSSSRRPSGPLPLYEQLVVNGGGGAFMHPTHVFESFGSFSDCPYEMKAMYPSVHVSQAIGVLNILKFREKNWRFDIVGGFGYYLVVFSLFPQVRLSSLCSLL
ncbi:hypothetical protein CBR_g29432 [Chara braunii]|uniref:Calcineurin-like phosphoesterase domain-containing protein n=1 Tax=Chara braunii TaxID=69332 RepID=A0A388LAR0_CHABU|nr:hypothetical protein CBR_g29432 [Chara braunii]|eukprot:GBG79282.1 hypothetical protein CBR_g29432 [Chara braunii]